MNLKPWTYHRDMDGKLHSNADSDDKNHSGNGAQFKSHQSHEAKQLNQNQRQYHNLKFQMSVLYSQHVHIAGRVAEFTRIYDNVSCCCHTRLPNWSTV